MENLVLFLILEESLWVSLHLVSCWLSPCCILLLLFLYMFPISMIPPRPLSRVGVYLLPVFLSVKQRKLHWNFSSSSSSSAVFVDTYSLNLVLSWNILSFSIDGDWKFCWVWVCVGIYSPLVSTAHLSRTFLLSWFTMRVGCNSNRAVIICYLAIFLSCS